MSEGTGRGSYGERQREKVRRKRKGEKKGVGEREKVIVRGGKKERCERGMAVIERDLK